MVSKTIEKKYNHPLKANNLDGRTHNSSPSNRERRFLAKLRFDPAEPTALLYRKTEDGYELEGAMNTAPRNMSEE